MKNKQLFTLDHSKLIRFSSAGLSKQRTYTLPDADAQLAGDVLSSTSETNLTGILTGNGTTVSAITTSSGIASIVSDETGTGALVFGTGPTFATKITVGTTGTTTGQIDIKGTTSGTAVIKVADVAGTPTLTLPTTTGTIAITGDKLSAFAATTSSELAGVISDETGSGLLVFATSPTLTTPNIGDASATKILNGDGTAAAPTYSFTSDPDTGIISSAANAIGIVTGGTEHWMFNSAGSLNPTTDNTKDIGNLTVNPRDINVSRSLIKKGIDSTGGYGQLAFKSISASQTLTNAQTNTLSLQIPANAMLIGVQLRNDTAIAGLDDATGLVPITTYSAVYVTGATQTIDATIAIAINTKVNKFFDSNAATNILSAATDITLDAGVGNKFTAGGIISAVAYYYELTSITDAV